MAEWLLDSRKFSHQPFRRQPISLRTPSPLSIAVHLLIVGGDRAERLRRADAAPSARRIDDLELAFPNRQSGGIRLVLTQSTYVLQVLVDALAPGERMVATADRAALVDRAPEAFERRGPWRLFEIENADDAPSATGPSSAAASQVFNRSTAKPFLLGLPPRFGASDRTSQLLAGAYEDADPRRRFSDCREAAIAEPESALAWIALASAARENGDATAARDALDRTLALAPDWAAAQFEDGKFWLASDDMARARDAFRRAGELMPNFSAAFSNLGATLGELDEPAAALEALERALASDPDGFTIVNNMGVVARELGRLAESEAAFERVVQIAPSFVFGYYNLGHTRFLAGDYAGALAAYEEGRRRDPESSPRQTCRLAMVRLANGDAARAERELWAAVGEAPPEEREDLLLEAYEIGHALITAHLELAEHQALLERIAGAIGSMGSTGSEGSRGSKGS
jgi:tetratricopeptide (TPR) repeat protein